MFSSGSANSSRISLAAETHRSSPCIVGLWKKQSDLLRRVVTLHYSAEGNGVVQALVASVNLYHSKTLLDRVHWKVRLQTDVVDELIQCIVHSVQTVRVTVDTRQNRMIKPINIRTVQATKD